MSAGNQAPKASFQDDELLGLRQVLEWLEWHNRLEARYPIDTVEAHDRRVRLQLAAVRELLRIYEESKAEA
jgi:hypothetical protein